MPDKKGRKTPSEWMESGWGFIAMVGIGVIVILGFLASVIGGLFA